MSNNLNNLNPLLVPEILSNVLKFVRGNDLLNLRCVCNVWNEECSIFIANKKIITIDSFNKLNKLLEISIANKNQPFRAFEFRDVNLNLDDKHTELFFQHLGPSLFHVVLNYEKENDSLLKIRNFRDILLYYTPNLKSLTLRNLPSGLLQNKLIFPIEVESKFKYPLLPNLKRVTIFSDKDYNATFLRSLFSNTVNLEEIIVEYGDEPRDFKSIFLQVLFSCAIQLQQVTTLKYFMHDPGSGSGWAWTYDECTNLSKMNLRLKSLKLHPGGVGQQKSVNHLLKSIAGTLEILKLRVHDYLDCPQMDHLTSLILYDYEGSLTFLNNLPHLRHLGLCEYFPSKNLTSENILPKNPHPLLSLNLYGTCSISTHVLRLFSKVFTNLRKLNLWHTNNEKFQIIVEEFKLLEDLIMNVTEVSDSAFTGIPHELCEQIERLRNFDDYVNKVQELRTKPHIGDLKKLRRLELHGASLADWQWSPLSDVGMLLGLVHLTQLTSLSLYEFKWITDSAIEAIATKLNLLYFKIDTRIFSKETVQKVKELNPDLYVDYVVDDFDSLCLCSMQNIHNIDFS